MVTDEAGRGALQRLLVLGIVGLVACAPAVEFDGRTDVMTVRSDEVGDSFEIQVHQPRGAQGPLPVVYVLDGSSLSEETAVLAAEAGLDALVVGIGYDDGFSPIRRRRDYTPTVDSYWEESGGLPEFRTFLLDSLLPMIEEDYDVSDERALFGHSLGGLATLEILWQQGPADPVFSMAVAASPALHWDLGVAFDDEAAYAEAHQDLPVELLLTVGQLDQVRIWSYGQAMMKQLRSRKYPGLELDTNEYVDALHDAAWKPAFTEGMEVLAAE